MCGSRDLLHKNDITIRNDDVTKCIKKPITKEVLEDLVNRGMTIDEIGKCLTVGCNTVVRHLRKHDLKTKNMVIYESRPTRKYDDNGNALCPDCGVILTNDNCHLRRGGLFYCVCKKCRAARDIRIERSSR